MRLVGLQEHGGTLVHLDHIQHETTQHADVVRELPVELLDERDQRRFEFALAVGLGGRVSLDERTQGRRYLILGRRHQDFKDMLESVLFLGAGLELAVSLAPAGLLGLLFEFAQRLFVVPGFWVRERQSWFGGVGECAQSVGADQGAHFRDGGEQEEKCWVGEETAEAAEVGERNGHFGLEM